MSLSTAFLFSCLFILYKTEATPTASLNATTVAPESATTSSKKDADASKKDVEVESVSGDAYVDSLSKSCQSTKDIATCVQFRALKFVHGMTSPYDDLGFRRSFKFTEFSLFGPLKLVALPPQEISTSGGPLFEESKSRSTDNELMKIFRFSLREVERFMRSYAFTIDIPTVGEDSSLPRIIDEDFFSGTLKQVAGRDKKKTLLFLLPLISFFHLKALLVPILLAVLFIKKLLVLGVIFLPSLLSLVKLCKPMHHHHVPWFSEPEPDYHSEYVPHYEAYKSRHGGGQGKRPEKHGEHHGSGPERNRYPETWNSPAPPPPPHQASTSQGWGDSVQKPISYVQQSSGGEASTNQVWGESNQKPISYVQQSSGEPSTNQAWSESNQKPINYVQQSSGGGTVTPSSRIDDSIDAGASPTRQRSGWNYGHRHQTWEHARDEEVGRGWNRVQSNAPYPWNRDRSDSREVKWDKEPNSGDSELENLKNFLSNFATNGHTNINQLIKTANDENLGDSYADSVVNSHNYYREKYETAESKRKKEKCDHDDPKESNKDLLPPMPEIRGNYSEFKTYMSS